MNDMHGNKPHKSIIYKDTRSERAAAEAEAERWKKEAEEKHKRKNLELLESESEKVDLEGSKRIDEFRLSYIEDYEESEAKRLVEASLGFEAPRVTGYHMAVKIYVRPDEIAEFTKSDGTTGKLYLPQTATVHDKYTNCTALVLSQGDGCYKGERFIKPWCKVGDWIVIPRNEGTQVNFRGLPVQFIADDRCLCVIQDPTWVTRD